jgi:hypothetical protein
MIALAAAIVLVAAAPPAGFRDSPVSPRVERIAAVAGAEAYCARSPDAWRVFLRARQIDFAYGLTDIPLGVAYLAPGICRPLEGWLRGGRVRLTTLTHAVFVAGHEAMHLRGIVDESSADCETWKRFRSIARAFGIRGEATIRFMRAQMAPEVPQCR